jgi:hypothetical protein
MVGLSVTTKWQVFKQRVRNRIASARAGLAKLVEVTAKKNKLILYVMAEKSTDLEIVGIPHFGEVILPDEKILVVVPWRRMQQRGIAIRTP